MSDITETYYIAGRAKDIPPDIFIPIGSKFKPCIQCNDTVIIDPNLADTADQSKGIVCSPCVQEITNMSIEELFTKNADNMMKILVDMLNRVDH